MVILLAEDNASVRFLILNLLEAAGFTVLSAFDGMAALEISRRYPGTIDLLVSDVSMPRMDGLELATRISAERPEVKVLLISGDPLAQVQALAMRLRFLQKPFAPAALRNSIEALLGEARTADPASSIPAVSLHPHPLNPAAS